MLGIQWQERRTNAWVLEKLKTERRLVESIKKRKMSYFGHVMRKGGMESRIIQGLVEGKRQRGRPKVGWMKNINDWTGLGLAEASRAALDRGEWRKIIRSQRRHNAN